MRLVRLGAGLILVAAAIGTTSIASSSRGSAAGLPVAGPTPTQGPNAGPKMMTAPPSSPSKEGLGTFHEVVNPGYNLNHLKAGMGAASPFRNALGPGLSVAVDPCTNPTSVACENTLPGDPPSDWSIREPGDLALQGFADDVSVNAGGTVHFKINNTNGQPYSLDILRFGWYQGSGARKVAANVQPTSSTQTQPACVQSTNATGLIDCGNWAESASWSVPANAVSGVYAAHLQRSGSAGSYIFFVVRNDASHSDIVYQTDDSTREAYNDYGGNSLYSCTIDCPPGSPALYKGAAKVSFNRPNIAAHLGGQYSFFGAEFEMVEFLEANGYDVSYLSGVDVDRLGAELTQHKAFFASGHDEYWSGNQRANVEAAGNAGVNLAFFSGNEIFWKTRYENSTDGTGTPYRTLVAYKETHYNAVVDPADPPTWTGSWRDPRFSPPADGGRPENALTGTAYKVDPPNSFAIQVPAADGQLRLWRNTSVAALGAGQVATLAPNTLGYEWDEDLDNGFRPPGNFDLSTTTENVSAYLYDAGNVEAPGVATHHLTEHRLPSGALVFGAGTVQWSWGLEGSPDGTAGPDGRMMQATINLLADMNVQPVTLISALASSTASTDTVAPTSTITGPAAGTQIADGSTVTITGTAADTGGGRVGGVEVSTDGGATWHPAQGRETWTYSWNVQTSGPATIKSRAVDDSGNLGQPSTGIAVTVTCPCQLFANATTPRVADSNDAASVEVGVKFQTNVDGWATGVRFYKAAANTGTHVGSLWSSTGQLLARATFTNETGSGWQRVTFTNAVHLSPGTTYVASYHTGVGHYAIELGGLWGVSVSSPPLSTVLGTGTTGNGVFTYATVPVFPNQSFQNSNYFTDVLFMPTSAPPFVVGQTPAPGTPNYSTVRPVQAAFSTNVVPSTISFGLTDANHNAVPGTVSYDSTSQTASFVPSSPLATGTTYTATVSGARDSQGQTMSPVTWSFTTYTCPCSLWSPSTTPTTIDSGDGQAVELGVRFSPDVNGSVTGVRFYKSAANTGTHVGSLWTTAGALLAQGTFTGETASGWQQLNFANPVLLTAGTTYIVSYHTNVGHYSDDGGYFATSGLDSGPLHAPADSPGAGQGLFTYSPTPVFPGNSFNSTNYWVDPVFSIRITPPVVISTSPARGATGIGLTPTISASFDEPINTSTLIFTVNDSSGHSISGSVAYNSPTNVATFTPSGPLAYLTTYTASVQATDLFGNAMTSPTTWTFTTLASPCPCSLWNSSTRPGTVDSGVTGQYELGVRFQPQVSGYVTGVRFYKGKTNTGAHTGSLWSNTGQLLATATFNNEGSSGWQVVAFSNPVLVLAGSTYVASYHTNSGHYSVDAGYFATSGVISGPLTAPANGVAGPNGVFTTGASAFPAQTANSSNYWVDVVFDTATGHPSDTAAPVVVSTDPANGAQGVPGGTTISATFNKSVVPSTIKFTVQASCLLNLCGPTAGTVTYDPVSFKATVNPSSSLRLLTTYTVTVSGAKDLAGRVMAPKTWSFSTGASLTVMMGL